MQLFGGDIDVDEHGESICGDTMLLLFNADHVNTIPFVLPPPAEGAGPWELVFDTAEETSERGKLIEGNVYQLQSCSVVVLLAQLERERASLLTG